jgi:hypothetical protein
MVLFLAIIWDGFKWVASRKEMFWVFFYFLLCMANEKKQTKASYLFSVHDKTIKVPYQKEINRTSFFRVSFLLKLVPNICAQRTILDFSYRSLYTVHCGFAHITGECIT